MRPYLLWEWGGGDGERRALTTRCFCIEEALADACIQCSDVCLVFGLIEKPYCQAVTAALI